MIWLSEQLYLSSFRLLVTWKVCLKVLIDRGRRRLVKLLANFHASI